MSKQKFRLFKLAGFIMMACIAYNTLAANSLQVVDLKCEYATDPIGLDVESPQFNWRIESGARGILQSAYQVIVKDASPDAGTGSIIWDSGKILSSRSAGIAYQGPPLCSRQRCFWTVRIWDQDKQSAVSDGSDFFEMALMKQEDWEAQWYGRLSSWTGRPLYYRCKFSLEKPVQKARVYISGLGLYELSLNGKKVGDHVLDPGVSRYDRRVLYATYDITDLLEDRNVIGIIVVHGWYGVPKLRMQAEITFTDGTLKKIQTRKQIGEKADYNWGISIGPIIRSSLYDGEIYDAREEKQGWDEEWTIENIDQYNTWTWGTYVISPGGEMVSQKLEPIKVVDELTAAEISEPVPGIYVADAGRNVAGWAAIRVKGERGTEVSLKFAESLYPDGTVNQENLMLAMAQDKYIMKGEGDEYWEPKFTYHGFRYVQLEGLPYRPKESDITVKVVRSAVEQAGSFTCSDDLLNRIHRMVVSTEASNLHAVPTDCPQRSERFGWMNDLTVRIGQALYNFNMARFYAKFIEDVGDTQEPGGSIGDCAPFGGGSNPADPVSASYLLLASKSYEFYGNEMIITRNYEKLKAWVDFLDSETRDGILMRSYWGDWSPPIEFGINSGPRSKNTPGEFMSTGYLYYSCRLLSRMAGITGNEKDANYYKELAQKTARAFNEKFWDEEIGGYGSNNQACNSFALFLGLVDKDRIPRVVENLVEDVKAHDYHLTTGNLCTKYLLEMLTEHGHPETAYKIATQETYPSWGYMLANGATTLWERWELATGGAMNSHNHPMMGSVDSWFYKYLAGIRSDDGGPGFERFSIRPVIVKDLDFVEGEFNSVKGLIKSNWRKEKGLLKLTVTIPANSTARVSVPTKNYKSITEGRQVIDRVSGIRFISKEPGYATYQVGSGTYHFESKWK